MTTTYKLLHPVQFGSETITELELKPVAKAFKGYKQKVDSEGNTEFDMYASALIAVRMSGRPDAVADLLHPADMAALAGEALGFFASGLPTGNGPSA